MKAVRQIDERSRDGPIAMINRSQTTPARLDRGKFLNYLKKHKIPKNPISATTSTPHGIKRTRQATNSQSPSNDQYKPPIKLPKPSDSNAKSLTDSIQKNCTIRNSESLLERLSKRGESSSLRKSLFKKSQDPENQS